MFYLLQRTDQAREVRQVLVEASSLKFTGSPEPRAGLLAAGPVFSHSNTLECFFPSILLSDLNANALTRHHNSVRWLQYF